MNSPSQETHHVRTMLILDHGQKQHDTSQLEDAQTPSKVMMIVRLHKGDVGRPSHTPEK
jgi:hypothetical protein